MASYTPAHYRGDPLLSRQGRHLVGRFSYGVTPALARQVAGPGRPPARGSSASSPPAVSRTRRASTRLRDWWPSLSRTPPRCGSGRSTATEGGWEVMFDYERWVLMRRMTSRRQLLEVMTEFWENHLNVPAVGDAQFTHRVAYGDTIRAGALGRFDDLLHAAVTHPAMLDLPRQRRLDRRAPQREPRARAAGAAHRGPRPVRRGRRQGQRPDPHRLDRRHVEHVGAVVRRRAALARHGDGDGLLRRQRGRRRSRPDPSLPRPTSPTTRPPPPGWPAGSR